ncbi:hypothetical protein L208DRAFT_1385389 [Tricholoma matsutake]|nr:hypothetical protein L208DRAFT_1385389 [Tricholoma matsutake 945]
MFRKFTRTPRNYREKGEHVQHPEVICQEKTGRQPGYVEQAREECASAACVHEAPEILGTGREHSHTDRFDKVQAAPKSLNIPISLV